MRIILIAALLAVKFLPDADAFTPGKINNNRLPREVDAEVVAFKRPWREPIAADFTRKPELERLLTELKMYHQAHATALEVADERAHYSTTSTAASMPIVPMEKVHGIFCGYTTTNLEYQRLKSATDEHVAEL
jgi:hypothetical protein